MLDKAISTLVRNESRAKESMSVLSALMGAQTKTVVGDVFQQAFRHRGDLSSAPKTTIAAGLGIKETEVLPILVAAKDIIARSLYSASAEVDYQKIMDTCDSSLDDRLKKLIAKVVGSNLLEWKSIASKQLISWPRMVDMDWRVDVKSSSQQMSRMSVPTVILDLKVEGQPVMRGDMPRVKSVNFELSKESLGTLLDGMNKIKDQLGALSRN